MNHRESMEEDDMVIRVGSSLEGRDEPMRRARRAVSPKSSRACTRVRVKKDPYIRSLLGPRGLLLI